MVATGAVYNRRRAPKETYTVVHPLDDHPEKKVDLDSLDPMFISRTTRVVLYSLQGYLIMMLGLIAFYVFHQAARAIG